MTTDADIIRAFDICTASGVRRKCEECPFYNHTACKEKMRKGIYLLQGGGKPFWQNSIPLPRRSRTSVERKEREMKEMVYTADRKREILFAGEYEGHKFVILSLGTHPTAYVECKLDNCNSYGDERLDDVLVHCGFTFLRTPTWDKSDTTLYLGWDYAHYCDYVGYYDTPRLHTINDGKKRWSTAEIYEEVKSVIDQLAEIERSEK